MDSTDGHKSMAGSQRGQGRKRYLAPCLKLLSPGAAKELLLRRADAKDPEVQRILDRIEELQGKRSP